MGIGRYDEVRAIYTTDLFRIEGDDGPERRTVHLGLDLFAAGGHAGVRAARGTVHAFADNRAPLDYGPVIVLRHTTRRWHAELFTLYGHLSRESLDGFDGRAGHRARASGSRR